jgi:hypothetical protein
MEIKAFGPPQHQSLYPGVEKISFKRFNTDYSLFHLQVSCPCSYKELEVIQPSPACRTFDWLLR